MSGLRTVFRSQVVDNSTGEVLHEQRVQVPVRTPGEGFAWVYQGGVEKVMALDGLCLKVWLWASSRMWAGRGQITIGRPERLEIMRLSGIKSTTSVSNALAELVRCELMRRIQPGRYVINPDFAWRGRIRARPLAQRQWAEGKEPTGETEG